MVDTRLRLTAVDETRAAFASAAQGLEGLRSKAAAFSGALAALPIAGFAAGLATSIRSAINAADGLDELSQKVGISVERLSELKFLLDVEGISTDQFQQGVKALSETLVKAGDATSREAGLLKALGVSARDPYEALRQIADAFKALPDGAEKTAVAADLLGKAGLALIPALNGGSQAIDAAAESARKLGLTLSAETAAKAAEFNDNMKKLSLSTGALGIALTERVVGGLAQFTSGLVRAKEEGRLLTQTLSDVLGTGLELASKAPIIGRAVALVRDLNAQRVAENEASRAARTASGRISGGFVGPPVPTDIQDRLRAFYESQNKPKTTGPKPLSLDEIMANSRQLLAGRQEEREIADERTANEDERDRRALIDSAIAERVGDRFAQKERREQEAKAIKDLATSYIDLIDPVAKYRRQLEEIDKLQSDGGLSPELAEASREKVLENVRKLSTETDKAKSAAEELGLTFASAFEDAIVGGKKFSEVLKGLGQDIARIIIRKSITEPIAKAILGDEKSGTEGLFSDIFGSIGKNLFGFATGGSFTVGGSGGTDSQIVAFRATPGERVDVRTPGQQGGGGTTIINQFVDVSATVRQQIAQAMPSIVNATAAQIADMRRRGVAV